MDIPKVRRLLEEALAELDPATLPPIETVEAFDQALAAAAPGAVLPLAPTLVYPKPLTLTRTVHLACATIEAGRVDRATPLPSFRGGLTILADDCTLTGLEVQHTNPLTDIVIVTGARVTLDMVRVLGDPVKGAKRGISANSHGDLRIVRCYVADCFATYPGSDSQAVAAWDMGAGLTIEDCYLEGGSETVLIGGADPSSDARRPREVTIQGNTITKNPAWQGQAIGIKNTIELKNVIGCLIQDNDISQSWGGRGQDGYLLVLTVRNQDGRDPGATIQDVAIHNNRFSHGAAAINILGLDTIKNSDGSVRPSVRMARVELAGNTFAELDPVKWTGSKKLILIDQGPDDLAIDGNAFEGGGFSSALYFGGGPPARRMTFTNCQVPRTTYGMFGVGVTAKPHNFTPTNPAWIAFTQDGILGNITEAP